MASVEEDYAKNFWQLGNIVAGFAAVQALVTINAIASGTGVFAQNIIKYRPWVIGLIAFFHFLFGLAVWGRYRNESKLLPVNDFKIICKGVYWSFVGRLLTVAIFGFLLIGVVLIATP